MAFFARDAFICTCRKEECDMCNKKYFEPFTNADRIRSMTNEELAKFLQGVTLGIKSPITDWFDWLKQEYTP